MAIGSGYGYQIQRMVFYVTVLVFVFGVLAFAFSGCDLRKRSEKAACKAGEVDACMTLGKYYEEKSNDILGFLMSNGNTSMDAYDRACKLGSGPACERFAYVELHSDSAKTCPFTHDDTARALAHACVMNVAVACQELDDFYEDSRGGIMAESTAARIFVDACKAGTPEGCFRFGLFMLTKHGDEKADPDLAKKMFVKACEAGHAAACAKLKS